MNLLERASKYHNGIQTLTDWLGMGAISVDREKSQQRADICLQCPNNVAGWIVTERVASGIREIGRAHV